MPEVIGVEFEKETGIQFQAWFGKQPSSWLLGKILGKITEVYTARLTNLGSSVDEVRQAQGALDALGKLDEACEKLARMNMDETETEDDNEGGDYMTAGLEEVNG